ncbi:MFS transporter [Leifsonia flava]|uniref:MFS transporter n=1 Tax=Orlajensenia leifsoniae TaxID=2561933 RepID=UPI00142FB9B9|nr:MFS transporter [Leifsonia flava]
MSSDTESSAEAEALRPRTPPEPQRPEAGTTPIAAAPSPWVLVGLISLIVLSAFESLAIMTAMPLVTADLDGANAYALAFSAPIAAGVIGMILAGDWADRRGPRAPLYAAVIALTVGLLIAGLAPSMPVFIGGRIIQGIGGGAITVPIYVIVARVYPEERHPRIFASFAAAWVLPSLIGPVIAGSVAESVGWRWVFLGVVALVVAALAMVGIALRGRLTDAAGTAPRWTPVRLGWSVLAAAAVLALTLTAELDGALRWIVAVVAVVVAAVALIPLVPPGTLRSAWGLPSVVLVRLLMAAAFFGAEAYVPYLLVKQYDYTAAFAGLALTGAGVAWALGSHLQGRAGYRIASADVVRWGATGLFAGIVIVGVTSALHLSPFLAIGGWVAAGVGMGFGYPRLSVLTLEYSDVGNQGANSSALAIADALGAAAALAATALAVVTAAGTSAEEASAAQSSAGFTAAFAVAAACGFAALLLGARVRRR